MKPSFDLIKLSPKARLAGLVTAAVGLDRPTKRRLTFAVDVALCFLTVFIAFSLRVGALDFPIEPPLIFSAVAVPLFAATFAGMGVYTSITRFAGARTIFQIAKAVVVGAIPICIIFAIWSVPGIPRTMALLHPIIFFGLVATSRIAARYLIMDVVLPRKFGGGVSRVLIYGAGVTGQQLALSLRHEPSVLPVGFVDDDARLHGQRLDGLKVVSSAMLRAEVSSRNIDTILLAIPRASRKRRKEIIGELRNLNVQVRTLPNISELAGGKVSVDDLHSIQIEDLLGRDPVAPNDLLFARTIVGKTILVTGAGGSIGSELCRQIATRGASRLVLFEQSEFALYRIDRELHAIKAKHGLTKLEIVPVLGSVTDLVRMRVVFGRWRPETVFHAAAYKHVPLVEANPIEGVRNNILGTYELVRVIEELDCVRDFALISTDKAVRPTNVMGASKRGAEQVVQAYAAESTNRRYSIVRFGNVLGSSGSVVPLFRHQIESGGPITLTHREVTRFFMTIQEAAELVIQAVGMAKGGEVFVLDMGNAVKIYDLARLMIELSGLTVKDAGNEDGDIEVVEVGLRSGEKLHEELLIGNSPEPTKHDRILKAREHHLPLEELLPILRAAETVSERADVIRLLKTLVPEFVPDLVNHDRELNSA